MGFGPHAVADLVAAQQAFSGSQADCLPAHSRHVNVHEPPQRVRGFNLAGASLGFYRCHSNEEIALEPRWQVPQLLILRPKYLPHSCHARLSNYLGKRISLLGPRQLHGKAYQRTAGVLPQQFLLVRSTGVPAGQQFL